MKLAKRLENALTCTTNSEEISEVFDSYQDHIALMAQAEDTISIILFKDMSAHVADAEAKAFYTCESVIPYLESEWIERMLDDIQNPNSETKH